MVAGGLMKWNPYSITRAGENEVGRVQKIEVDYNKKDWQNSLIRLNHDQEMA